MYLNSPYSPESNMYILNSFINLVLNGIKEPLINSTLCHAKRCNV